MLRLSRWIPVAIATLTAFPTSAQDPQVPVAAAAEVAPAAFELVIEAGGDFGSTKLVTVPFEDGDVRSLKANQGAFLSAGGSFLPLAGGRLRTHATIGVKYAAIEASNGSIDFLAFPLEIIETLDLKPIRLGAGVYALLAPGMSGDGFASGADVDFDSTMGFTVRAEWVFGGRDRPSLSIGPRFVWNRLTAPNGASVDAQGFGFVLSYGRPLGVR